MNNDIVLDIGSSVTLHRSEKYIDKWKWKCDDMAVIVSAEFSEFFTDQFKVIVSRFGYNGSVRCNYDDIIKIFQKNELEAVVKYVINQIHIYFHIDPDDAPISIDVAIKHNGGRYRGYTTSGRIADVLTLNNFVY